MTTADFIFFHQPEWPHQFHWLERDSGPITPDPRVFILPNQALADISEFAIDDIGTVLMDGPRCP